MARRSSRADPVVRTEDDMYEEDEGVDGRNAPATCYEKDRARLRNGEVGNHTTT